MRFYRSERSRRLMYRSQVGIRPWILLPVAGALIMAPLFLFFVATTTFDDQVIWTIFNSRSWGMNIPQALWVGLVTFLLSSAISFGLDWRQAAERKRPVSWMWVGLMVVMVGLAASGYSLHLWSEDLRHSLLEGKGLTARASQELLEYAYFDRMERRFKVTEERLWKDLPMLGVPTERSRGEANHQRDWTEATPLVERKVEATERILIATFETSRAGDEIDLIIQPERWLKGEPDPTEDWSPEVSGLLGNGTKRTFSATEIENALGYGLEELIGERFVVFWSSAWEDRLSPATEENLGRVEQFLEPGAIGGDDDDRSAK
ncbi:MAG: hypothetical protein RL885_26995 [Planctomycetota bacterium]